MRQRQQLPERLLLCLLLVLLLLLLLQPPQSCGAAASSSPPAAKPPPAGVALLLVTGTHFPRGEGEAVLQRMQRQMKPGAAAAEVVQRQRLADARARRSSSAGDDNNSNAAAGGRIVTTPAGATLRPEKVEDACANVSWAVHGWWAQPALAEPGQVKRGTERVQGAVRHLVELVQRQQRGRLLSGKERVVCEVGLTTVPSFAFPMDTPACHVNVRARGLAGCGLLTPQMPWLVHLILSAVDVRKTGRIPVGVLVSTEASADRMVAKNGACMGGLSNMQTNKRYWHRLLRSARHSIHSQAYAIAHYRPQVLVRFAPPSGARAKLADMAQSLRAVSTALSGPVHTFSLDPELEYMRVGVEKLRASTFVPPSPPSDAQPGNDKEVSALRRLVRMPPRATQKQKSIGPSFAYRERVRSQTSVADAMAVPPPLHKKPTLVFIAGLEGTGHHYMTGILNRAPNLVKRRDLSTLIQQFASSPTHGLYQDRSRQLKRLIQGLQPGYYATNVWQPSSMMSFPYEDFWVSTEYCPFKARSRCLSIPNLVELADVIVSAGARLEVLWLTRSLGSSLASTTVKRQFQSAQSQIHVLTAAHQQLLSQMSMLYSSKAYALGDVHFGVLPFYDAVKHDSPAALFMAPLLGTPARIIASVHGGPASAKHPRAATTASKRAAQRPGGPPRPAGGISSSAAWQSRVPKPYHFMVRNLSATFALV